MHDITVAVATITHLSLIVTILNEATDYKINHNDTSWGTDPWTENEVKEGVKRGDYYLITISGEVVGTFSLLWDDPANWGTQPPIAGYLHRFAIKDGFHGKGIGKESLVLIKEIVSQNNRKLLRLDCNENNTKLCAYYESLGFIKQSSGTKREDYTPALYEYTIHT